MTRTLSLLLALTLTGCAVERGDGQPAVDSRVPEVFHAVAAEGSLDVDVRVGADVELVEVFCDANLLEYIETEVRDGVLHVGVREGVNILPRTECSVSVKTAQVDALAASGSGDLSVEGTVLDLREVRASGSGSVEIDDALGAQVSIEVTGSGDAEIETLEAVDVEVRVTGSGSVELGGVADLLDARVSGSGEIEAAGLSVDDATASVSGSGGIALRATGTVDVQISGSGDVVVFGGAEVNADVTGSGEVLLR